GLYSAQTWGHQNGVADRPEPDQKNALDPCPIKRAGENRSARTKTRRRLAHPRSPLRQRASPVCRHVSGILACTAGISAPSRPPLAQPLPCKPGRRVFREVSGLPARVTSYPYGGEFSIGCV